MKVDKEKFIDAVNYLKEINKADLLNLDLSEFFEKDHKFVREEVCKLSNGEEESLMVEDTLHEAIEHWGYTGLNNRDFILLYHNKEEIG